MGVDKIEMDRCRRKRDGRVWQKKERLRGVAKKEINEFGQVGIGWMWPNGGMDGCDRWGMDGCGQLGERWVWLSGGWVGLANRGMDS
jgi:hypothetical protein